MLTVTPPLVLHFCIAHTSPSWSVCSVLFREFPVHTLGCFDA